MEKETPEAEKQTRAYVLDLSRAYVVSRAIHVAAALGVADHVGDTPVSVRELARVTSSQPDFLERLLRLLASHRIFSETAPGEFIATPSSVLLRTDAPSSLRPALMMVNSAWWASVGDLGHSLKTGQAAFAVRQTEPFFSYLKQHPDDQATFDAGMATNSRASDDAIASAYDFSGVANVVDIGGGRGGLVRAILEQNAHLHGTVFDQPQVVAHAVLPAGGPLSDRYATHAGDFFKEIPAGADVYLVKGVLHDFDDERCVAILENCRRAMSPRSKLLIVERLILPDNRVHQAKTIDLLMMALLGGRERAHAEWALLMKAAGLAIVRHFETGSEFTISEAVHAER